MLLLLPPWQQRKRRRRRREYRRQAEQLKTLIMMMLPLMLLLLPWQLISAAAASPSTTRKTAAVGFITRPSPWPSSSHIRSPPSKNPLIQRQALTTSRQASSPQPPPPPLPPSHESKVAATADIRIQPEEPLITPTTTSSSTSASIVTVGPPYAGAREAILLRRLQAADPAIESVEVQDFYYIRISSCSSTPLMEEVFHTLKEAAMPSLPDASPPLSSSTVAHAHHEYHTRAYAPRPSFRSVWSSNVRAILVARGVTNKEEDSLQDLEMGRWYRIQRSREGTTTISHEAEALLYDRMTECPFSLLPDAAEWGEVDKVWTLGGGEDQRVLAQKEATGHQHGELSNTVLLLQERGAEVLEEVSEKYGLGLGPWEIDFLTELFLSDIGRNPTEIEIFDVAQSLSEHCRHWTFDGQFVIDGEAQRESLMEMVKAPWRARQIKKKEGKGEGKEEEGEEDNSLLAFCDNSSAMRGPTVLDFQPSAPDRSSPYIRVEERRHLILTAETHNFPCSIAPFPGAQTGVGGRIRDILATGRGGYTLAGLAGYAVGNLQESKIQTKRPSHVAPPLEILLRASDGASDYANKYGEPLIGGFTRAMKEWQGAEFLKPIMFSGGVGKLPEEALQKESPQVGMAVVKLGGPAYRVGLGGGAASSKVGGKPELDLQAVQRGDPEMGNKVGRVIRACLENYHQSKAMLLQSVHDQGAGGNANVLKELVAPAGADIYLNRIERGDSSLTPLEVWGAEYQESQGVLVEGSPAALASLERICRREATPMQVVGHITGHGAIRVYESEGEQMEKEKGEEDGENLPPYRPLVDLPLAPLLSRRPKRVIDATRRTGTRRAPQKQEVVSSSIFLPPPLRELLRSVLGTVSVGSKAFLTNKVDRSVTGLVAAQPCVGPLHLPVGDVGVTALSFWGKDGVASALGECPGIGLVGGDGHGGKKVPAMVRMAVGEALTNLVGAPLTRWEDIKLQANWMWPGREGEAAGHLYDGVETLRQILLDLGLALDGGKDSLSMATDCGSGVRVPSPPTVVITAYAPCVDVGRVLTPDVKVPAGGPKEQGILVLVELSGQKRTTAHANRALGGSALEEVLAEATKKPEDETPDLLDPSLLRRGFETVQELARAGLIQACHDVSSGGLITTVLEMAMSGDAGAEITLPPSSSPLPEAALFAEELGWVLEIRPGDVAAVQDIFQRQQVPHSIIGKSTAEREFLVTTTGKEDDRKEVLLREDMDTLRHEWQATSFELEKLQASPACIKAEEGTLSRQRRPIWSFPRGPLPRPPPTSSKKVPRVGVLREQGSNGDREMAAALHTAGFDVWDLTVQDLLEGEIDLTQFQGLAFVGGFSYGDALGSARGWKSVLQGNRHVEAQLQEFFARPDTWSLGLCNGCQLLVALGIVPGLAPATTTPGEEEEEKERVWLQENDSGRFESRFVTVKVGASPAVLLQGMEGTVMGVWSAHGEGKFQFENRALQAKVLSQGLAPVRYVDPCGGGGDEQEGTEEYPFNPNGSPMGVAALCSPDGRHLAMMPHPERSWLRWQMPWMPSSGEEGEEGDGEEYTPWLRLFKNAFHFSLSSIEKKP